MNDSDSHSQRLTPDGSLEDNIQLLVVGVGNEMMGDEGVGVRVVRELIDSFVFPDTVAVVDGGLSGMSLLPMIRAAEEVVIIDAVEAAAKPGSIFMFNSEEVEIADPERLSVHDAGIREVIRNAALMGDALDATIIGVQPKKLDDFGGGISKPVAKNINRVIEIVLDLLASKGFTLEPKGACSLVDPTDWNGNA